MQGGTTNHENENSPSQGGVGGCLSCSLHGSPRLGHPPGPDDPFPLQKGIFRGFFHAALGRHCGDENVGDQGSRSRVR
jgi:hypothetical protein